VARIRFAPTSFALVLALVASAVLVRADGTPQVLPFTQAWTTTTLVTTNDNWAGVPGIQGFLGQDITTTTGTDPRTLLGTSASATDLDVIANQSNTGITNGGVAEFDGIANPTIALQGSGTADAPYVLLTLNTAGQSGIRVAYTLRDIDGSGDNAVQQVALQYRVGASGPFTNVPEGYLADATEGPSLAGLETPISVVLPAAVDGQPEVQVRIITTNAPGNDEWVAVDDISVTAGGGPPQLTLSVTDASATEGDAGLVTARVLVRLSAPAGAGGVTFDLATADGTALAADNDYSPLALASRVIAEGATEAAFDVGIFGDTTVEPNEQFAVVVGNVVGAAVADDTGAVTILNDDVQLTAIHAIQGSGPMSPLAGAVVSTRGIVTALKSNGFFLQTPDAAADDDPLTSEGIVVFTGSPVPPAAAVGALLQVTGTVTEFVPGADPVQPPLTEIAGALTIVPVATGQPLPAPVAVTASDINPSSTIEALERVEGMRVSFASLTVTAPTQGFLNEASATSTSSGIFYAVVTGVPRPFREPGIQVPDPLPAGAPASVPRFDANPERIRVDSDAQPGAPPIDVPTGAVITGLVGVVDYAFRTYTILPDAGSATVASAPAVVRPVRAATATEATVASFNLERFFDTVNDAGISDVALTPAAFETRLAKASRAIRESLRMPDVLGVVEMENLSTLQTLAARIGSDAVAAGLPDPGYAAYLVEGNDPGGIDVGLLVKTAPVAPGVPRVEVIAVAQEGSATTYTDPNTGQPALLNDRPPLVGEVVVHYADGRALPVTVIVNHLRSLNDVANEDPQGSGTVGARVRAKRAAQAEFLARLVQARLTANPGERLVLVGDFNAFQFSDGLVDVIGTIKGTPAPADTVTVASPDLVDPDLVDLVEAVPPADRYSYVFDGNAQVLDHVLASPGALASTSGIAFTRGNADAPETARNLVDSPSRISDHDAAVVYLRAAPPDVTAQIRFTRLPFVLNPFTRVSLSILGVTNRGPAPIAGPLHLVFDDLAPGLRLLDASGAIAGDPYLTLNVPALRPGETWLPLVRFANPGRVPVTFTPRVLSGVF
jgi:predicted extracellular nuclease